MYDLGLEGAQIEDKIPLTAWEKEQMFVDILPDGPEDDGVAYLSFFVEEKDEKAEESKYPVIVLNEEETTAEAVLAMVQQELDELKEFNLDIGEGTVSIEETEDIDWINNWKQYFHQFTIDDVLVIPSWEEVQAQDQDKMILHIDPGTAFGTGMHDTTQLCIRQLKKYITPETVLLDVGTGSGILSILSLMFGAKKAVGTDLDPCAVEAMKVANLIGSLLNMKVAPGNSSIFVGNKEFEIMKKPGRGTNGHIAIGCNNVDRAIYHLSQRGVKFDLDSKNVKNGKTVACYMADEIAGFAFHLVQA